MTKINQLNYDSYKELLKICNNNQQTNPWFDRSYPIFTQQPFTKIEDLIPLIAFAYSWMPTIPTIKFELLENDNNLLSELRSLQSGEGYNLYDILNKLVPAINNSLVGTTKALHFLAPEKIAIIDSRVVNAWKKYIDFDDFKFPYSFTKNNIKESVNSYVQFNYIMNMWRDEINQYEKNFTLRDLEFVLYKLGGKKQ